MLVAVELVGKAMLSSFWLAGIIVGFGFFSLLLLTLYQFNQALSANELAARAALMTRFPECR